MARYTPIERMLLKTRAFPASGIAGSRSQGLPALQLCGLSEGPTGSPAPPCATFAGQRKNRRMRTRWKRDSHPTFMVNSRVKKNGVAPAERRRVFFLESRPDH